MRLIERIKKALGWGELVVVDDVPWGVEEHELEPPTRPLEPPGLIQVRTAMPDDFARYLAKTGTEDADSYTRARMSVELVDLLVKEGYAVWLTDIEPDTVTRFLELRFSTDKGYINKLKKRI